MTVLTLAQQTQEALDSFISSLPEAQQQVVGTAFQNLLASSVADSAIQTGDTAPDFSLPNVHGGTLELRDALAKGPVVLSFYRGSWCPFCNLELNALQQRLPDIKALGASLIAVSPEKPDASLSHAEKLNLEFEVLSDIGNKIAESYGLIMRVADEMQPLYLEWGINIPEANGDNSYRLPVPATYVIDSNSQIHAAYIDKNYTSRMEPEAIVQALKGI